MNQPYEPKVLRQGRVHAEPIRRETEMTEVLGMLEKAVARNQELNCILRDRLVPAVCVMDPPKELPVTPAFSAQLPAAIADSVVRLQASNENLNSLLDGLQL